MLGTTISPPPLAYAACTRTHARNRRACHTRTRRDPARGSAHQCHAPKALPKLAEKILSYLFVRKTLIGLFRSKS
jgi:hypothetical protein